MKFHMILNVLAILVPVFGSPLIYESNDSNQDTPTEEPEFCHKLECPKYTRVEKHAVSKLQLKKKPLVSELSFKILVIIIHITTVTLPQLTKIM